MSTPPWDIYAQQLEPLGYGYPLWTPDPAPGAAQVDIGDVGFIKDGEFIALFNIFRGEGEEQPRGRVPTGHVPLDISNVEVVGPRDKISHSPLYSRSIRVTNASGGASISAPNSGIHGGINIEFECTEDAGALLVLAPSGRTQNILSKKRIVDYMHANLDRWLEFANDRLGIGLKENQIILVSGTTKTNVWAVAAFAGKTRSKTGSIAGNLGSIGAVDFTLAISDAQLSMSHYRAGPTGRMSMIRADRPEAALDPEYDQCIFIHYYKRKRRFIPPFMRAGAGPHELPSDTESSDDTESTTEVARSSGGVSHDWEFEQSPKQRTRKNLVDHTLDYILEKSPDATFAIACDMDFYQAVRSQSSSPSMQSHNSESDAIKHLSMLDPQVVIDQNGVGVLADEPHHDQSDRDGNLPDARGDITRFPPKDSALQFFGTRETSSFRGPLYTGLNERARQLARYSGFLCRPRQDTDRSAMDANEPFYDQLHDDGTASDVSDDVVEVRSDEIPLYFEEREGRLFHSHGSSPYPLPVDADEQQRQTGLSRLLRRLIGDLSVGPVRELLACAPLERRRVVDLGTGTGQWVLDMAREFPHVKFYGVDIVPIATRYPPQNVIFEIHDIMEPFRYASGSIDMVHARSISMAIRDYRALLPEVARILRDGGLFVSCEWSRVPAMVDGSDIALRAPRTDAFFTAVRETLRMSLGITSVAQQIPRLLEDSRQFTNIEAKRFHAPIGDWHWDPEMKALGHEFREMMIVYARSMKEVLLGGPYAAHAETLAQGYLHDIRIIPGIVSTCFTVHARKVGPGTTPKARERMEGSSISADISDVTRSDGGFKLSSSSYSPSARVEKG